MTKPLSTQTCLRSLTRPQSEEITEEPALYRDEYGFLNGTTGKALCGGCGRDIGLLRDGRLTQHRIPREQDS